MTSYGRSNHAKMRVIRIFICFTFDPLTGRGVPIDVSPLQNQQITHAGIVCVFFILSLFHVQTQSSFTQREKMGISVCPHGLAVCEIHISSLPTFRLLYLLCAREMLWCYTSVPIGAGSTSKLSNRVNHSCGFKNPH